MKRERLLAVHDDDLANFLRSIGLLEDLVAGRLLCSVCGDVVTLETLAFIYPEHDLIRVACSKPTCASDVTNRSLESSPGTTQGLF